MRTNTRRFGLIAVVMTSVAIMAPAYTAVAAGKQPALKGIISTMPTGGRVGTWTVGGTSVQVTRATRIQVQGNPLAMGSCSEVKIANANGILSALMIETKPAAVCADDSQSLQTAQTAQGDVRREDRQQDRHNDDHGGNRGIDDKGSRHDDAPRSEKHGGK